MLYVQAITYTHSILVIMKGFIAVFHQLECVALCTGEHHACAAGTYIQLLGQDFKGLIQDVAPGEQESTSLIKIIPNELKCGNFLSA